MGYSYSSTSIILKVPFAFLSSLATPSSNFLPDTSSMILPAMSLVSVASSMRTFFPFCGLQMAVKYPSVRCVVSAKSSLPSIVIRNGYVLDLKLFSFNVTSVINASLSNSYSTHAVEILPSLCHSLNSLSSRVAVNIVKATAGANADSSFASFDDNELSDWHNDGKISTAWIAYELEREALVSEVEFKLNNFRSRAYPLRITVDGKEVFADTTQRSLGYFTAICKPQKGTKVKIELATFSKDAAGNTMLEVSGKKLDDGVARDDKNARGTLSIIEIEVYEHLKK